MRIIVFYYHRFRHNNPDCERWPDLLRRGGGGEGQRGRQEHDEGGSKPHSVQGLFTIFFLIILSFQGQLTLTLIFYLKDCTLYACSTGNVLVWFQGFLGESKTPNKSSSRPAATAAVARPPLISPCPASVTSRPLLDLLASLYSHTILNNLMPNLNVELYFIVELLQVEFEHM